MASRNDPGAPRTIPPDWHLRSRLKTRQLALLVALDDERNLRRAAATIAVTQPAATNLLHDLEDAVGVPLFERRPWGMEPTAFGETLIRYARGVMTDLNEARDELAALAAGAKGKLRIGCVTGGVPRLLVPAVHAVRDGRPGLRLFLLINTSDVLVAGLAQGTLEVAIGRLPADAPADRFDVLPLGDEPLCFVARAGHPRSRSRRIAIGELASLTWIVQPPGSPMRQDLEAMLVRARLRLPTDLIETASIVATLALLRDSDAVGVLPVDLAEHYAGAGLVVRLPVTMPPGGSRYELIRRAERRLSPAAEDFVVALQNVAAAPRTASKRRRPTRTRR